MKRLGFLIVVMCSMLSTQCEDNYDLDSENPCDNYITINRGTYEHQTLDNFEILEATIIDDCLSVKISGTACSSKSVRFSIIDSGSISESLPKQRFLRVRHFHNTDCTDVFEYTITFNIIDLRIEGSNTIILNLEGWGTPITYSY